MRLGDQGLGRKKGREETDLFGWMPGDAFDVLCVFHLYVYDFELAIGFDWGLYIHYRHHNQYHHQEVSKAYQ